MSLRQIDRWLRTARDWVNSYAPEILGVLAIFGVGVTTGVSIHYGRKAERKKLELEVRLGRPLTKEEFFKEVILNYIPPIASAAATAGFTYGAIRMGRARSVSLALTVGNLISQLDAHNHAEEIIAGPDDARQMSVQAAAIHAEQCANFQVNQDLFLNHKGNETAIYFEGHHHEFFEATGREVLLAEYLLNRRFAVEKEACLNDFYDELGVSRTTEGDILSWKKEDGSFIDFHHTLEELVFDDGSSIEYWLITESVEPLAKWEPKGENKHEEN